MNILQLKIALSLIPNIGPRLVRRLVSYTGSIEAVFSEKKRAIEKVPGIGSIKAGLFDRSLALSKAETELEYITKNNIKTYFYLDNDYPIRLQECEDGPVILFSKGEADFNSSKVISIVGTRNASEYGKSVTAEIVGYLAGSYPELVIVSGLAYGIDIAAHKAALENGLATIAVLGHGFNFLYPAHHRAIAGSIKQQGALLTEFPGERKPDPGNFVSRNRIIAGLADATIVVESATKGGALITADIANSYNRDVFAVPGRAIDQYSSGCNMLIKQNKASLAEQGADIEAGMQWISSNSKTRATQQVLFKELSAEQKIILNYLDEHGESALDHMSHALKIPVAKLSANLLNMEFDGLVKPLPGKYFRRN